MFALGGNDLGPGFSGSLGLGCHGPLELHGKTDVFAAGQKNYGLCSVCANKVCSILLDVLHLHFHALNLDAPRIGGVVQRRLHDVGDGLAFRQDFRQIFGAQYVSQRGGGQQPR